MIRKILKWIGIVLGSLIGLLLLSFVVISIIGAMEFNRTYDVPVESINIPTDAESIKRGEHLASIRVCKNCHGEDLSGNPYFANITNQALFILPVPNLTSGKGGVGVTNTDEDWIRAIRHGVGNDGRALIAMPSSIFYYLSDEDLGSLIAYIKTIPPVDNEFPQRRIGLLGRPLLGLLTVGLFPFPPLPVHTIDHDGPRPIAPQPDLTLEYGHYLARSCTECHGEDLSGATIEGILTPNLTPGGELAHWSREDFFTTMRTGVRPSGHPFKLMPWKYLGQMTDEELTAVWMYLQSLPALEQSR